MRSEMFKKLYIPRRKISSFSRKIIPIYMSCYFGLRDGLGGLKLRLFICFSEKRQLKWALCWAASRWLCLTRHDSPLCIACACVASVCLSRKFGREQKGEMKREGKGETLGARAITRLETLVRQANYHKGTDLASNVISRMPNTANTVFNSGFTWIMAKCQKSLKYAASRRVPNITNFYIWLFFSGSSHQSLECHTCYSDKSWGDCHRNAKVHKCPSFLNTCMKVHRTTRYPGGKAVHQFAKSCFARDVCKMSFCEQRATNESHVTCQDLSCCSTPLCNYG